MPQDKLMLVDTHTHLHFPQFDDDRDAVIERALAAGVTRMVAIGTDLADSAQAIALAAAWPGVIYATVGVHPNVANDFDDDTRRALADLAAHDSVVAIGEVGLDFFRERCPVDQQRRAFIAQQELALELGLPLVVHGRESHDAVYDALDEAGGFGTRVVVHCFTSHAPQMLRFAERGCWVGVDGPITYPKATDAHEVADQVPTERLLLETDCPYLAPQRRRGKRCEPADVVAVAQEMARRRNLDLDQIAARTTANAAAFFGWETS